MYIIIEGLDGIMKDAVFGAVETAFSYNIDVFKLGVLYNLEQELKSAIEKRNEQTIGMILATQLCFRMLACVKRETEHILIHHHYDYFTKVLLPALLKEHIVEEGSDIQLERIKRLIKNSQTVPLEWDNNVVYIYVRQHPSKYIKSVNGNWITLQFLEECEKFYDKWLLNGLPNVRDRVITIDIQGEDTVKHVYDYVLKTIEYKIELLKFQKQNKNVPSLKHENNV